jgi:tetratricopeptide (TPR) repeat protein
MTMTHWLPGLVWAVLLGPATPSSWELGIFTVTGKGDDATVSANTNGVTAEAALQALAKAMGWGYRPATERVVEELTKVSIDLSFTDQKPRIVAHLIAVTAGMDVAFDDRTSTVGYTALMHVAPAQPGDTPAGRERLRKWAVHWYRSFLSLETDPLVEEQGLKVSMHLGNLRMAQGDLEGAIQAFSKIYSLGSTNTNYWTLALLRMAQAAFELGNLEQAEKWAKELTQQHPSLRPTAEATVLVGKILLRAKNPDGTPRYDECVRFLEASCLRLASAPEIIDIYLLIAEAERYRNRPDKMLRVLDILAAARPTKDWTKKQWLDYHFLRGIAAEGTAESLSEEPKRTERLQEAIRAMEMFLGVGTDDPRRGVAYVVLGRGYLGTDRYLEARAAALEAMGNRTRLDRVWLQHARILEAKTALVLDDRDVAFMNLETQVRKPSEHKPALILFLVDSLIEAGRYQQAITNADLLTGQKSIWGDRARYRRVLAMFKSAQATGIYTGFTEQAIRIAQRIEDKVEQRKVAELIGRAYEAQKMIEKAADAYRGMLR